MLQTVAEMLHEASTRPSRILLKRMENKCELLTKRMMTKYPSAEAHGSRNFLSMFELVEADKRMPEHEEKAVAHRKFLAGQAAAQAEVDQLRKAVNELRESPAIEVSEETILFWTKLQRRAEDMHRVVEQQLNLIDNADESLIKGALDSIAASSRMLDARSKLLRGFTHHKQAWTEQERAQLLLDIKKFGWEAIEHNPGRTERATTMELERLWKLHPYEGRWEAVLHEFPALSREEIEKVQSAAIGGKRGKKRAME